MKKHLRDEKSRSKTIETNESLRLKKRPTATNSLEDFGSSFTKLNAGTRRDAKTVKNTFDKTKSREKAASICLFQEINESDDELLLSSQPSTVAAENDDLGRTPSKSHKHKSQDNVAEECSRLKNQGSQLHTSVVVKKGGLKFHKNKTKNNMESHTPVQEPICSFSSKLLPDRVSLDCCSNTPSKGSYDNNSVPFDSSAKKRVRSQSSAPLINEATPRPTRRPQMTNRGELALEDISVNSQVKPLSPRPGKVKATDCLESTRRKPVTDTNVIRRSTLTPVHPAVRSRGVNTKADPDHCIPSVKKPGISKLASQIPDYESSTEASRPRRGVKAKGDLDRHISSGKKPRIPKPTSKISDPESSTEASRPSLNKPQDFPLLSNCEKRDGASRCLPAANRKSKQKRLAPKPFPLSLEEQGKESSLTDFKSGLKRLSPEPFPLSSKDNKDNSPVGDCKAKQKRLSIECFPMSLSKEKRKTSSNDVGDDDGKLNSERPRPRPKRLKSEQGVRKAIRNIEQSSKKDGKESTLPGLQPFPMNTQMLKGTGSDSIPSAFRKREHSFAVTVSSDEDIRNCDWDEDFSVALSVDPKLLCPFCDVLLPQPLTPFLKKLINSALKKSRHDPRPWNSLGRKAPSAIFITVCQRHTFESEELPKAKANGWPKSIDWELLGDRIRAMRDDLEDLLSDLRVGTSTSFLWEDMKRELQAKGSRAVGSVREQFANFEKAQAGYYGELGYAIIHQSLLDLFPPTLCDLEFAKPLTPEQFFQRVLVPEVALRLIQEDMNLRGPTHIAKALQVLRDSSKYGVAMFPDDSNDNSMSLANPDQLGVADMIVMERARRRRQELEEEYQKEQEEQEFQRNEERKRDKKRRKRTKSKADDKHAEEESESTKEETEHETGEGIFRPRPRPLRKKHLSSRLSQASTPEYSGYEGSEECFSNFVHTTQELFTPSEFFESSDSDFLMGPVEEILVPDSDEEERGTYFSARRGLPSHETIVTEPASGHDGDMTSSSEDMKSSLTFGNRHKKQRDWEDEESTPKPAKFARTGVPGIKESNSHPLLLARKRRRQPSGTEATFMAKVVSHSNATGDDNGIWVKSMMAPATNNTLRRQWSSEFAWLLSDGSQECQSL